jgi:hypothetical protein
MNETNKPLKKFEDLALQAQAAITSTMPNPFWTSDASIFLLDTEGQVCELLLRESAYDGLQEIAGKELNDKHIAVGVFTSGWAAPLTCEEPQHGDLSPSNSPERLRVHLCVLASREFEIVSVIQMQDTDGPLIQKTGEGNLADAMVITMLTLLRSKARRAAN